MTEDPKDPMDAIAEYIEQTFVEELPKDMDALKAFGRMAQYLVQIPLTRTNGIAVTVAGMIRANVTGMPKESVLKIIDKIWDRLDAEPEIVKIREEYKIANEMSKKLTAQTPIMAPESKYTH